MTSPAVDVVDSPRVVARLEVIAVTGGLDVTVTAGPITRDEFVAVLKRTIAQMTEGGGVLLVADQ